MSNHGARQQKKLAQKKAKREKKRSQLARQTSDNPVIRLANCESWPIINSMLPPTMWDKGMGQLVLSRRMPNGFMATAVFLVDSYCLGVKNAFWKVLNEGQTEDLIHKMSQQQPLETVTPEHLVKVARGAVAYALNLGFPPHPDYRHAGLLLEGIDPSLCSDTFEFGKDGKPLYIRGPGENMAQATAIMQRVQKAGGDYIMVLGDPTKAFMTDDKIGLDELDEGDFDDDEETEELPPKWGNR